MSYLSCLHQVGKKSFPRTWPLTAIIAGDEESRPTARAIKERLFKIKELSKISSANSPAAPSTPAKGPRNKVAKTPKTPKGSTTARKSRKKNDEATFKVESHIKAESTDEGEEIPDEVGVKTEEAIMEMEEPVKNEAAVDKSDVKSVEEPSSWNLDVEI